MTKRGTLQPNWLKRDKPPADRPAIHPAETPMPSPQEKDDRKGQTLRLNRDAWKALKMLAADLDRDQHELLIEAVNDLFRKYERQACATNVVKGRRALTK